MKNSLYIMVSLVLSCNASNIKKTEVSTQHEVNASSICPEEGTCSFEVLRNSSIKVLTDDLGSLYSELFDSERIVLKFEYKKDEIPNTADSSYREEIYLELNPNNLEINLNDQELKKVKLHFGRYCFCKGQTGLYEISKGKLSITKTSANHYLLNLEFKTDEVPQVITKIIQKFSLQ